MKISKTGRKVKGTGNFLIITTSLLWHLGCNLALLTLRWKCTKPDEDSHATLVGVTISRKKTCLDIPFEEDLIAINIVSGVERSGIPHTLLTVIVDGLFP